MKKYNVKLLPTQSRIATGSIVKYNDKIWIVVIVGSKVLEIKELNTNKTEIVELNRLQAMKYKIIYRKKIVGELDYNNYADVSDDDILTNLIIKTIPVKAEIGDTIGLCSPVLSKLNRGGICGSTIKGVIIALKNRDATIDLLGDEVLYKVKRHRYKLVDKPNTKVVCSIV